MASEENGSVTNFIMEVTVDCPSCGGTGIFSGRAETPGTGVLCTTCNNTGAITKAIPLFQGKRKRTDIKMVFRSWESKEGIPYEDFLNGKLPE